MKQSYSGLNGFTPKSAQKLGHLVKQMRKDRLPHSVQVAFAVAMDVTLNQNGIGEVVVNVGAGKNIRVITLPENFGVVEAGVRKFEVPINRGDTKHVMATGSNTEGPREKSDTESIPVVRSEQDTHG